MKMSPREFFALRDYLGPEFSGRTISDARRDTIRNQILGECRAALAPHKVRATSRFVEGLDVTPAGKPTRADS